MPEVREDVIDLPKLNSFVDAVMDGVYSRLSDELKTVLSEEWLEDAIRWEILYSDTHLELIEDRFVTDITKYGYFCWSDPTLATVSTHKEG